MGWGIRVELLTSLRDDHKPLGMTLQLKIIIRITYCKYSRALSTRVLVITNNNCSPRGRGGGSPHMKVVRILVVSLRGVNFGFWSHLGCSGQNAIIFSREGLV